MNVPFQRFTFRRNANTFRSIALHRTTSPAKRSGSVVAALPPVFCLAHHTAVDVRTLLSGAHHEHSCGTLPAGIDALVSG